MKLSLRRDSCVPILARVSVAALILVLLGAFSCTIGPGNSEEVKLGVPYRAQVDSQGCGAASVLMWRLYAGLSEISELQIMLSVGGIPGVGMKAGQITQAAAIWAWPDVFLDYSNFDPQQSRRFFARQITSIGANMPIIPIVEGGSHAGVINGGHWRRSNDGLLNVWESVYFHDPKRGSNMYFSSAQWEAYSTAGYDLYWQVISNAAITGWENNYGTHSATTVNSNGELCVDCPLHQEP